MLVSGPFLFCVVPFLIFTRGVVCDSLMNFFYGFCVIEVSVFALPGVSYRWVYEITFAPVFAFFTI